MSYKLSVQPWPRLRILELEGPIVFPSALKISSAKPHLRMISFLPRRVPPPRFHTSNLRGFPSSSPIKYIHLSQGRAKPHPYYFQGLTFELLDLRTQSFHYISSWKGPSSSPEYQGSVSKFLSSKLYLCFIFSLHPMLPSFPANLLKSSKEFEENHRLWHSGQDHFLLILKSSL